MTLWALLPSLSLQSSTTAKGGLVTLMMMSGARESVIGSAKPFATRAAPYSALSMARKVALAIRAAAAAAPLEESAITNNIEFMIQRMRKCE